MVLKFFIDISLKNLYFKKNSMFRIFFYISIKFQKELNNLKIKRNFKN